MDQYNILSDLARFVGFITIVLLLLAGLRWAGLKVADIFISKIVQLVGRELSKIKPGYGPSEHYNCRCDYDPFQGPCVNRKIPKDP